MKFQDLIGQLGHLSWFDFQTVVQLTDEPKESLRIQLHRWCRSGKLVSLRRGYYALGEIYRKRSVQPAALAHVLYTPSYLSLQWALSYHGLIPERGVTYTSVTTRQTREFSNAFGIYQYRHVKNNLFFECEQVDVGEDRLWISTPEKTLLDFWYLEKGPWSEKKMEEMRFQNFESVNPSRLEEQARIFDSPKIRQAVSIWRRLASSQEASEITL